MNEAKAVSIYTDGGCDPNPGPGGYGVILLFGKHRKELSGGFRLTTNNRMELYAAIAGLQALQETCRVTLSSDSEYLVNAMTQGWIQRWERKGWKKVKNPDLWKILLVLCSQHQVTFNWIKGHAGHPENERCDQLAMHALLAQDLPADEAYEREQDVPVKDKVKAPVHARSVLSHEQGSQKITTEGQPCRKCATPVIKKTTRRRAPKAGQSYYFEYILLCPSCKTLYLVEDAKRYFTQFCV